MIVSKQTKNSKASAVASGEATVDAATSGGADEMCVAQTHKMGVA